ncbi:MAG TPA: hypothetical protein VH396_12725 [Chitinophagaceae bacterium]
MISKTNSAQSKFGLILPKHNGWATSATDDQVLVIKKGIWVYFLLLIFEGALRKWFLPGLATPLLIIRDPVALWILFISWKQRLLPLNPYVLILQLISIVGTYTAVFLGHGNIWVALFGARIFLIHFPLIFVIGQIFNRDDVVKMGRMILLISVFMTFLIALQYYSPQSAWINRGVAGDINGAGFSGVSGFYRPPGTFSFTIGTTLFYDLVGCLVLYFWFHQKEINSLILIISTISFIAAVPLTLSRGLSLQVGLSFLFSIAAILRKPQYILRMIIAITGAVVVIFLLSKTTFFETSTANLTNRFAIASNQEGGLGNILENRFLGGLIESLKQSLNLPFFGYGLGMGTNAGGFMLTGTHDFLISELEWGRIIGELGPIVGLIVIFLRLLLGANILMACYRKMTQGDFLPWMLLSFGLLLVTQGSWGQATSLGFSVFVSGLMIASLNDTNNNTGQSLKTTSK